MFRLIKGMLFFSILTFGAFVSLCLLAPSMVSAPIHSVRVIKLRHWWTSVVSGLYFNFAAALITYFCGTKIFLYSSDPLIKTDKGSLIVSNHRTRVDWMFSGWCYAALTNRNANFKVIAKDAMRSVPIYGWAMQAMMYIFLRRNRDLDIPHISNTLLYLFNCGIKPSIFLFPEGTDLSKNNIERNNKYAREKKSTGIKLCFVSKASWNGNMLIKTER